MNYLKTFLPYLFGNKQGESYVFPNSLDWENLSFEESLMFHTLGNSLEKFFKSLTFDSLTSSQIYHLLSFQRFLSIESQLFLEKKFPNQYEIFLYTQNTEALKTSEVQEILNHKNHQLSVFVVLDQDRTKPGKLFIRSPKGDFHHNKNDQVWSIPVLALSRKRLPFNHSNGATPCGVFTIDSVMPEANKQQEFGKFRRLKVNFLAGSFGEENTKQFLPRSHHQKFWWQQAVIGRELGRSLLRIHGTGEINKNPFSPYFPMTPSSGCLTVIETHLFGAIRLDHQRILLDTLMQAMGLLPTFLNESKIHGLLYVIEFDGTYQALEFKR